MWSSVNEEHINVEVITTGLSDHRIQLCTIKLQKQLIITPKLTYRRLSPENLNHLKHRGVATKAGQHLQISTGKPSPDLFIGKVTRVLSLAYPLNKSGPREKIKSLLPYNDKICKLKEEYLQAHNNPILQRRAQDKAVTEAKKRDYALKLKQLKQQATLSLFKMLKISRKHFGK